MNGDDIICALLRADPAVTAIVQAVSIQAAALPDNVQLPALLVTVVSSTDRQPLTRGATVRVTERVAVTVRAINHFQRRDVIRRVRSCCAGKTGNIGGGDSVAILTAGQGPDLSGPGTTYEKTQDFRVSFEDPT